MKIFNLILSIGIILASAILCQQIIFHSLANQNNKNDYAELNHVKYGLLSMDEWKRHMAAILAAEINQMYLSRANERKLKKHIEVLLNTLIDKVDKNIREENSASAGGRFTQSIINIFINLEGIKKGIPEYADAVIQELNKAQTKRQIKAVLNKKLEQYSDKTFDALNTPQLTRILARTDTQDIEAARAKLSAEISFKHALILKQTSLLILLSIILFAIVGLSKQSLESVGRNVPSALHPSPSDAQRISPNDGQQALAPSQYIFLTLSLIILLVAGVTTPMIDMEATISQISFVLMGHPVQFDNQVLYFQSKSILDVFWIMITDQDIQMKFVGILLVSFSIVFPLLKIIASMGYYFDYRQARENSVVKFFVFRSGKWSMADVMVVAIFMAYIGFNGIITSQLGHLSKAVQEVVILTTNGTSLQPGFYLFLTYIMLSLFLSGFLTRNIPVLEGKNPELK